MAAYFAALLIFGGAGLSNLATPHQLVIQLSAGKSVALGGAAALVVALLLSSDRRHQMSKGELTSKDWFGSRLYRRC